MRIKEISERFNIPTTTLRYYEKIGLFDDVKRVNGIREYEDKDIRDLGMMMTLKKAGLGNEVILRYLELSRQGDNSSSGRIKILKLQRQSLLDDIHDKQKNLDTLDYLIYELKKQ